MTGAVGDKPAAEPEDEYVLHECFRELIPTLKGEYAELIEWLELGDESAEAAARWLGITPNNLKVRRHRIRQALRRRLAARSDLPELCGARLPRLHLRARLGGPQPIGASLGRGV